MSKWIAIFGLLVAMAGGCVETINPVLNDEQVIVDNSLAGTWVQADATDKTKKAPMLEVQPAGDDKKYTGQFTDENGKKSALAGRLGKIDDVEVVEFSADPAQFNAMGDYAKSLLQPLYFPLVIRPSDANHITALALSPDWFKKYIEAHPDELQVVKMKDDVLISSSTEDFQKFLLKHLKDDGAMSTTQWVRKVKLAAPIATQPATAPAAPNGG